MDVIPRSPQETVGVLAADNQHTDRSPSTTNIYNINCPRGNVDMRQKVRKVTTSNIAQSSAAALIPTVVVAEEEEEEEEETGQDVGTGKQEADTQSALNRIKSLIYGAGLAASMSASFVLHPLILRLLGFFGFFVFVFGFFAFLLTAWFGWARVFTALLTIPSILLPHVSFGVPLTVSVSQAKPTATTATDTFTLTFRRPVPTAEANIKPTALTGWQDSAKTVRVLLDDDFLQGSILKAQQSAKEFREFNQHFIPNMETRSTQQYALLHSLVRNIKDTMARHDELIGTTRWWWQAEPSLQQDALNFQKRFLALVDDIRGARGQEQDELEALLKNPGNRVGIREASLRCDQHEASVPRELGALAHIFCSSGRRTTHRWDHVGQVISKFKRRLDRYPGIVQGLLDKSQSPRGVCVGLLGYLEKIMNDIVKFSDMEEEI
ncbi:hypothetical protein ACHAPU_008077 [Fusarium lateritium]